MSDWTDAEYNAILGFTGGDEDSEDEDDDSFSDDEMPDMLGIALATTVDHTPLMTPVKSQGGCGSCWAFAATSALEGTIGVNTGVISERLSEQQGVDCTRNTEANEKIFGEHYGCWGCSGCWMAPHWRFMRDHGVMTNEDYTYTAKNEDCKHDNNKIKGKTKEWGIAGKKDVKAMKAKVMQQPGAVALHASSK
jgi:cathepsin L